MGTHEDEVRVRADLAQAEDHDEDVLVAVPEMSICVRMHTRRGDERGGGEGTYFFTTVLVRMNRLNWICACFSNMSYSCDATALARVCCHDSCLMDWTDIAFVLGEFDGDELDVPRKELQDRFPVLPHTAVELASRHKRGMEVWAGEQYVRSSRPFSDA